MFAIMRALLARLARRWADQPRLVRFLVHHAVNGMVLGCVVTLGLIWGDVGGVGRLVSDSALATALLFFQMALTFGAVAMGIAVMRLRGGDD